MQLAYHFPWYFFSGEALKVLISGERQKRAGPVPKEKEGEFFSTLSYACEIEYVTLMQ
jgi:hypothetical protein